MLSPAFLTLGVMADEQTLSGQIPTCTNLN